MNTLRRRLTPRDQNETGLSLIEVVVAMMIFAMISTGAIYTMISVLAMTRDNRSTQVAANLAAQEIDLARDYADLFDLVDATRVVTLNGDDFRVNRSTQWVSDPGNSVQCGSDGAPLRYKRVNIDVTWSNMRAGSEPVRSSTLIDPKNRINDPALGTILVTVLNTDGEGEPGVTVDADPLAADPNGAAPLTVAPKPTDAQGCTYVLKVKPGNYELSITKPGYVDGEQNETSTSIVPVAAGEAATAQFEFDEQGEITLRFAWDYTAPVIIPRNLDASFLSTAGTSVNSVTNDPSRTRVVNLLPNSSGYEVLAGKHVPVSTGPAGSDGCLSPDPSEWKPVTLGGIIRSVLEPVLVATPPGGSATVDVPMGIVTVQNGDGKKPWLRAVSATAPNSAADPGCAEPMTYDFGAVLGVKDGTTTIALPYGSWKLYSDKDKYSSKDTDRLRSSSIAIETIGSVSCDDVITLDPRSAAPAGCGDDGDDDD